jgi:CxxC-x17-CxxC domain-containing protein
MAVESATSAAIQSTQPTQSSLAGMHRMRSSKTENIIGNLARLGPVAPETKAGSIPLRSTQRWRDDPFPNDGRSGMEFVDRLLTCADCGGEFIFTAGEQLFFLDKQFKNDPKRCKPCKSRRSAQAVSPEGGPAAAGISRTETRTECSECGISTTVPFKPTQGRPVLCRQCFKNKRPIVAATLSVAPSAAAPQPEMVSSTPTPISSPAPEHTHNPSDLAVAAQSVQA